MSITYNVAVDDGVQTSVTVFTDSGVFIASRDHRHFDKIISTLTGDPKEQPDPKELEELFDAGISIERHFSRLGQRVSIKGDTVYLDGDPINNALTQAIVAFYEQGEEDYMPLVNFMEKLAQNPNPGSVEQLYVWLTKHRFSIHPDGDFIAYKGVDQRGGGFSSVHAGTAFVNGVEFKNQRIPTSPGAVVEMPRSQVEYDPTYECHRGLHAGNWGYASAFASVTLRVKINPRDVVSVPHSGTKIRTCRYHVLGVVNGESDKIMFRDDEVKTLVLSSVVRLPKRQSKLPKPTGKPVSKRKPGKVAAKKKVAAKVKKGAKAKEPRYYEDFRKADFESRSFRELRWLAKEWELGGVSPNPSKVELVQKLTKKASNLRMRKPNQHTRIEK